MHADGAELRLRRIFLLSKRQVHITRREEITCISCSYLTWNTVLF